MRNIQGQSYSNANLFIQQQSIHKHFECFNCKVKGDSLTCYGKIIPEEGCQEYRVKIQQKRGQAPKAWIIKPQIKYNRNIHMFEEDNSLCLYDCRINPWQSKDYIYSSIIPWIAEWIVLYELYIIHGQWLGPEAPHYINYD